MKAFDSLLKRGKLSAWQWNRSFATLSLKDVNTQVYAHQKWSLFHPYHHQDQCTIC